MQIFWDGGCSPLSRSQRYSTAGPPPSLSSRPPFCCHGPVPPRVLGARLHGHAGDVRRICVCANAGIATSVGRTVKFWTINPEKESEYVVDKVLTGHSDSVGALAWIPPSYRFPQGAIVSGGLDTSVLLWDLQRGEVVETMNGHKLEVTGLAVDTTNGDIISSSMDGTLVRWRDGNCVAVWEAHKGAVQTVIKLPTSEIFTGSSDSTIRLWKGMTCQQTFSGHTDTVRCLAPMPGLGILSASHDKTIKLWSLTGQPLVGMIGHSSPVYSVDGHSSGLIASGSEDCTLKIWRDGVCVQSIEHPGCIWDVKFLENGDIVTACSDGIARVWTTNTNRFCSYGELAATDNSTQNNFAPELSYDCIEEILVRLPPDEPSHLINTAIVSRNWNLVISSPSFFRRFSQFHRRRPLLGFFYYEGITKFVQTSASPLPYAAQRDWRVIDGRHGNFLVLNASSSPPYEKELIVWDATTNWQQRLPMPPFNCPDWEWSAALLCAAMGCDHLNCPWGPFFVVFVWGHARDGIMFASVYSSEEGAWREPVSVHHNGRCFLGRPTTLVNNSIYFGCSYNTGVLEYNFGRQELSVINLPPDLGNPIMLMTAENGGLGFANMHESKLCLWSRDLGMYATWTQQKVLDLSNLLPARALSNSLDVNAIAITDGTDFIFIRAANELFTIGLRSSKVKKVGNGGFAFGVVPYMRFCIPA